MRGKRKAYYASKLKRAAHLLFYRRHKKPGVKGWELRKNLGKDYPKVLKILDDYLERLDLQVKTVFEEERPAGKPTPEQLDKARFFVTLRGTLTAKRKEVEKLLREKLPKWRADLNLDRYIRYGYIIQDEKEQLYLGWRTQAEVDQKALINLLLGSEETSSVNA